METKKQKGLSIGVDLGTVNTLVYVAGKGVVFNEPSVVAYNNETGETIAVGKEAAKMVGKTHHRITISKPLHLGVISDIRSAGTLIEYVLQKIDKDSYDLSASTLLLSCPSEVTQIERDSLIELASDLGIGECFIEEEVKAGAIGAGADIFKPQGAMVIDIGGGSTDIGVLSLGDIVNSESIRVAGTFFDEAIIKHIQFTHQVLIGSISAEKIKKEIGTLDEALSGASETMKIAGRDLLTGLPKEIEVTQKEIRDVLIEAFEEIVNTAQRVLQQTPPELAADIINDGIIVNGGGALIHGIADFLSNRLQVDVKITNNALTAICEGTKVLLKNKGSYLVKPLD
ncbi:rod shape-determining protein [Mycoplasmatota bacterium zrk1]